MSGRMNPTDLANIVAGIRDRFPVSAVAARMGVKLHRAGNEMKACCPFHADRTPSFTIYASDRRAHCFSCGWSGDVLDLVQHGYRLKLLGAPADSMIVTEGLEDGLTLSQACRRSVWVAAGTSMMPEMMFAAVTREIVIGADGDAPGEPAAAKAAAAFAKRGLATRIMHPARPYKDFNAELMGVRS